MAALAGKQVVIVIGQKNYNDDELDFIRNALEVEGADVHIASNSDEKALGRIKGHITPDVKIEDLHPKDFDAIIVGGGYGTRVYLWDNAAVYDVLKQFSDSGKWIGALNNGPVVLANAGILENKKATVYPDYDAILLLEEKGAKYIPENIIVDENIITVNHSRFVDKFMDEFINKLKG